MRLHTPCIGQVYLLVLSPVGVVHFEFFLEFAGGQEEGDRGEEGEEGGDDEETVGPGQVVLVWAWHPLTVLLLNAENYRLDQDQNHWKERRMKPQYMSEKKEISVNAIQQS